MGEFIKNLSFPVINSNIELGTAPALAKAGVRPYAIFPKYNLGIIGFITNTTGFITKAASDVIFNNPIGPVQKAINELHSKGINRIVCLSHNGYFDDQYLAENTRGISLIVGGHSHSLLLNNASEPGADGKYPTKAKNLDGKTTWVVQAHRFGDYLGHVDLEWNEEHDLISIQGYPILLDQTIPKEPQVQAQIDELSKVFGKYSKDVLTVATGDFDTAICRTSECPLGDLVADAMLEKGISSGAELAMTNAGGLRSSGGHHHPGGVRLPAERCLGR